MGFLSGILNSIGQGLSDFFGGGDDQKKKQQAQQQSQRSTSNSPSPIPVAQAQSQFGNLGPNAVPLQAPDNGINLLQTPLKKAAPAKPATTDQTTQAPQPPANPTPASPNPNDPIGGLLKFAGDTIGGLAKSGVNTLNLIPDAAVSGIAGLTGNEALKKRADGFMSKDYDGSLVKPVVNTVKLVPDAIGAMTGQKNSLNEDAHSSLIAPLVNTGETISKVVSANNANNDYTKANQDAKASLATINADEAAGKITSDQATTARNGAMALLNSAGSKASGAVSTLSKVDPYQAASDAANSALIAEPLVKASVKGINAVRSIGTSTTDAAAVDASKVAPGIRSVNPTREVDAAQQVADATPPPVPPELSPEAMQKAAPAAEDAGFQPTRGEGAPLDTTNEPAFVRARAAAEQKAAIDESTQAPSALEDIPAYQRQGKTLTSDKDFAARAEEIKARLAELPSAEQQRIAEFNAHRDLSDKVRQYPGTANISKFKQTMKNQLDGIKSQSAESAALTAELDKIQTHLSDVHQQTKTAQNLQAEADAAPATAPAEVPPAAANVAPPAETPVAAPASTAPAPAVPAPEAPVTSPTDVPPVEAPAAAPAAETTAAPTDTSTAPAGETAAAPRSHDALVSQVGEMAKELKGKYNKRDAMNIEDLKQKSDGVIANMSDKDLLDSFASADPGTIVHDNAGFSLARSALDRLGKMSNNPAAVQTVSNILNGMDQFTSKNAQGLRLAQEAFDTLPLPMKVRYLIKSIDKANKDVPGYKPLADDVARQDILDRQMTNELQNGEKISQTVSEIKGKLEAATEAAKNGTKVDTAPLIKQLDAAKDDLAVSNGKLVDLYDNEMPKRTVGQKANDFARTSMLGSVTGRLNDVASTGLNVLHQGLQNITQGVLAKAVNLVKPGAAVDTLQGGRAFVKGTVDGVRRGAEDFTNTTRAGDLKKSIDNNMGDRTNLVKSKNPIARTVQAATEFATRATEGVHTQRVYQLAVQEAQKAGVPRQYVKQYAEARAAVPTRAMTENADKLHMQINNINDNPISKALNKIANAIDDGKSNVGDKASVKAGKFIAGTIKNQVLPFTSWVGGNFWNSFTDRNVVASTFKAVHAATKGDLNGFIENTAKTINNAAHTYALGYMLTKNGVITNQDAQGYNDGGAYVHIGDRYIPAGFFGSFGPSIIMGNAAYNAVNNPGNKNPAQVVADAVGKFAANEGKSASLGTITGADNNIARAYNAATQKGSTITPGDTAAQLGAGVAGTYIPGITGDINAVLNNGIPGISGSDALNKTHEAADTKVTKINPATGNAVKDVTASAGASLANRIPLLSQTLPRKANVASADMLDRVTKGNQDTAGGIKTKADAQAVVDQTALNKKNGIPDPAGKNFTQDVQAHIENGKLDEAIQGLQQKMALNAKDGTIPKSTNDKLNNQIKELTIVKDNKYDPSIIDLYKKTSNSDWRGMGNPKSENYDPQTYDLLYQYDSQLAGSGVSGSSVKTTENKFIPAKAPAGKGKGSGVSKAISSNTVNTPQALKAITLGNLAPQKITSGQIPTIASISPSNLIKARTISVSKGR